MNDTALLFILFTADGYDEIDFGETISMTSDGYRTRLEQTTAVHIQTTGEWNTRVNKNVFTPLPNGTDPIQKHKD